jgi:hypothetical protein
METSSKADRLAEQEIKAAEEKIMAGFVELLKEREVNGILNENQYRCVQLAK